MKSFLLCLAALFITMAAFSQKKDLTSDTTLTKYLTYHCAMHPQYVSNVPAKCPVCNDDMTLLSKKEMIKMAVTKLYTCPMDSIVSTKGGKCPKCGMEMVELKPNSKLKQ